MTNEVRDLAIQFEAKKVSVNQNKDGIILRLSIHPDDCPPEIWKDWVGTRYGVAMVQIGDDEQPTAHNDTIIANKAIASAAMLCRDHTFQQWMAEHGYGGDIEVDVGDLEAWTIAALRQHLGIVSRSEMKTNKQALEKFRALREEYMRSFDGSY